MIETVGWNNIGGAHPNSCRIRINAGDSLTDLIAAMGAFITTHGWEEFDAAAGTNARAYRLALLPDATGVVGFEYIVLDYNTSGYVLLKLYESWNAGTHTGTALIFQPGGATGGMQRIPPNAAGVFTTSGYIQVAWSQFLGLLYGFNGTNFGNPDDSGPTFVVQLSRVSQYDLESTGYSKMVWATSHTLFQTSGSAFPVFSPRNRCGANSAATCGVSSLPGFSGSYGAANVAGVGLMPLFNDTEALAGRVSNFEVIANSATISSSMGTALDIILMPRNQNIPGVDDYTFTATDDQNFGGAAYVNHEGSIHTWWVVGGLSGGFGRLLVRK